jgi:hypothetical protein
VATDAFGLFLGRGMAGDAGGEDVNISPRGAVNTTTPDFAVGRETRLGTKQTVAAF